MERITIGTLIGVAALGLLIFLFGWKGCDECYAPSAMGLKAILYGFFVIAASVFYTHKFLSIESTIFKIDRQEILDVREATEGTPFAGEGEVVADRTIKSPYTGTDCVYYHAVTEAWRKRNRSSEWVVIENLVKFVPFRVKDRSGEIEIAIECIDKDFSEYKIKPIHTNVPNPKHSEIECFQLLNKQKFEYKYAEVPLLKIPLTESRRRSEWALLPGTKVFVYGYVEKRDNKYVLRETAEHPLIISLKSKDAYVEEFYKGGNLIYASHFFISLGYTVALIGLGYFDIGTAFLLPAFFIGNAIIIGSIVFSLWNRIVQLDKRAENALAEINVELKRRHDLFDALIPVVREYAKYEREIHALIAEIRRKVVFHKSAEEQHTPTVVKSLVAIIERYSGLKANENFKRLMEELIDTEERIAYAREFYNRTVMKFNATIAQFPFILISLPLGIKPKQYITLEAMA